MSSSKMEMSLDDIIKTGRKDNRQTRGGVNKNGPIKTGRKNAKSPNKNTKKAVRKPGAQQQPGNNAATKRLVQKLVQKALAQKNVGNANRGGPRTRVVRKVVKTGGVARRSQVIKKTPRTETVVVRRVVQPRPRTQVVRKVIVEEPIRRRVVQPVRRTTQTRVVYVQQRGGNQGGRSGGGPPRKNFGQQKRRQNQDPFYQPRNYLQRF